MSDLRMPKEFLQSLDKAIRAAEARKAAKDTCPDPRCGRPLALMFLSFRGLKVAYFCRFCGCRDSFLGPKTATAGGGRQKTKSGRKSKAKTQLSVGSA